MIDFSDISNISIVKSLSSFLSLLTMLVISSYIGKFISFNLKDNNNSHDDIKIILGASLSLLGLLIGFVLSISINGYNQRQLMEENEAIAIGNAYQRIQLLDKEDQDKTVGVLNQYLEARIFFFTTGISDKNFHWKNRSLEKQSTLWSIGVNTANKSPTPVTLSILAALSDLYTSQQKTMASWRHQIPNAAWLLLLFFPLVLTSWWAIL